LPWWYGSQRDERDGLRVLEGSLARRLAFVHSCDPAPSHGDYCACADADGVFSLKRHDRHAACSNVPQVQCSPEADCPSGSYADHAGNCQTARKGIAGTAVCATSERRASVGSASLRRGASCRR